jgi:hypothetical protein
MPKLVTLNFEQAEYDYTLDLHWLDVAFQNNEVNLSVTASRKLVNEKYWKPSPELNVSIVENDEHPLIQIKSEETFEQFGISSLSDEAEIIDKLPAQIFSFGDPISGCLIRAGLSSILGQIIVCRKQTSGVPWFKERAKAMGLCLKEHIPEMTGRAAFKAAVCIAKVGF